MNKKIVTVVLEVESDDDYMMTDDFIKTDLEQEINCASNSYNVVSITIGREALENLPVTLMEPHWISVTEKLPEVNGRYFVTRGLNACGAMWNRVYLINYSDLMGLKSERVWWDGNVGKSDFERIDDVLAWMSLPEPYRGQHND